MKKRKANLEIANEMYKMAFLVKKQRFAELFPHLSEPELHKMTVQFFKNLPKD